MTTVAHDIPDATAAPRAAAGLGLAMVSAVSFGLAGALARPLLEAGWSAGAVVLVRIGAGALVVLPLGIRALRGRWHLVRRNAPLVAAYGVLGVAGAQFCYFSAVRYLQVGPALLIEFTAPAAVVVWMWLRHGERPGVLTVAGAVVAALGLLLVLDVVGGVGLHPVGVAWALAAMVGAATYFVISGDTGTGLPPLALAAGGLVGGAVTLSVLGLAGVLPMAASTASVSYAGAEVAWWVPLALLGVATAALAYVAGIGATRILGSRLASFVALSEVVAAVLWAWALLGELPRTVQLVGGLLVIAGVAGVKLGERSVAASAAPARQIPDVS